jgi:DNA-binding response OmpR family regulator
MPVLMLTARSSEADKVLGLETGADDYITKPFSLRELIARVKAMFRRIEGLDDRTGVRAAPISIGDRVVIDSASREVRVDQKIVPLTHKEFDLLLHFARNPDRVYTREQLLDAVWGYTHEAYEHAVNCHINRLRAKVERDPARPELITTVWGVGYKLLPPAR